MEGCKVKEILNGKIVQNMMESIEIIKSTGMESTLVLRVKFMRVDGKMELDTDRDI